MAASDPYDLERFSAAQAPVIDTVRCEIAAGRKQTHWMWFVFPQLDGLGASAQSRRYAIRSLAEARAYLQHPQLGARLRELTGLVLAHDELPVRDLFGFPDCLKFHSSMTLFHRAAPNEAVFSAALTQLFGGVEDPATLERLDMRG